MPLFRKSTVNDRPAEKQSSGLFGRKTSEPEPAPARSGIFGSRRRSPDNRSAAAPASAAATSSRRRSSDSSDSGRAGRHTTGGIFGMGNSNDNTITAARNRVSAAEAAEKDADRALLAARTAVKDARQHVSMLEKEAEEEARRARMKQAEFKSLSKTAKNLGRHDENHNHIF